MLNIKHGVSKTMAHNVQNKTKCYIKEFDQLK
jgi:hypothetical protein